MPASTSDHDFELNFNPLPLANRIDEVCDQFESAWKSGERPTIGDFLDETIAEHASELFVELVRIDMEYRALHGEIPSYDEYASEYPQFSDVLTGMKREGGLAETITVRAKPEKTLGRYELIAEVGGGGFGTVWRAWDTQLQRLVAIKVPRNRLGGPSEEKAFLREARTFAELEHPNIVPVFDSGTTDGTTFIASRFIEGVSLRKWMKARTLSPREIARICEQLAEAMEYAHSKGVIHRDLKPSNVLIDEKGQPHITDFGLATRKLDDVTIGPSGEVVGTPAYMSPEQVRGKPKPDARSDIYSLGATLYEMLTGRVPFRGDQATVLLQVVGSEPEAPRKIKKSIPADLETICQKAMEKERGRRYQTATQLAEDLRRMRTGQPLFYAKRATRFERLWRWARRNPAITTAVTFAVVAVFLGTALAFQSFAATKEPPQPDLRRVNLATEPPGARLVCYRLDDRTGEPVPAERTEAVDRSPASVDLRPGDYLVVAALDDGRFHEVYRHVPDEREQLPINWRHRYWKRLADGTLFVEPIRIPEADVVGGMALIPGNGKFASLTIPTEVHSLPSILVDPYEFTVEEYRKISDGKYPYDRRYLKQPDEFALAVDFELAVSVAERAGKRLPTSLEYELTASHLDASASDCTPDWLKVQEVGSVPKDRTAGKVPVFGLISNVAEWTMTAATDRDADATQPFVRDRILNLARVHRIVRGMPSVDPQHDASRKWVFVSSTTYDPAIGFRCVRSATPRLASKDFLHRAQVPIVP